jgi:hypothetical protein
VDAEFARRLQRYPPAKITPREFEEWAASVLGSVMGIVEDLHVAFHDRLEAADGTYEFDGTVRFRLGGMDYLTLIEAKLHKKPIERELVQVLQSNLESVGALDFDEAPLVRRTRPASSALVAGC